MLFVLSPLKRCWGSAGGGEEEEEEEEKRQERSETEGRKSHRNKKG